MTQRQVEQYRRWFAYEQDSHAKVLDALRAAGRSVGFTPPVQRAIDLCAHIVAARRLWLYRLGAAEHAPEVLFPKDVALDRVAEGFAQVHDAWSQFFSTLDDEQIARAFEYRSLEGPRFRNVVADILTQLFGHSWYHRGQVALLLRQAGAEPVETDFVFWTREPLDG